MADRQFMRLGDDFALAADDVQWILQRRHPRSGGDTWDPISFVHSTKDVLARCMREKGVSATDAAAALTSLPDTFQEWVSGRYSEFSVAGLSDGPQMLRTSLPSLGATEAA